MSQDILVLDCEEICGRIWAVTFKEQYLQDEPLNEVCDRCNRQIIHWDYIYRAFLAANGRDILCNWCRSEENALTIQQGWDKVSKL